MTLRNLPVCIRRLVPVGCLLIMFSFWFCGCGTTLKTVDMAPAKEPYHKIAVMVINTPQELRDFSKATFDTIVNPLFTNLRDLKVRTDLEKAMDKQLYSPETAIIKTSDIFKLHENVSYTDYLDRMKNNGAEAVLILAINTRFRPVQDVTQNHTSLSNQITEFSLLYYLVDLSTRQQVWAGVDHTDYRINNIDLRSIGQKLTESHYINQPHALQPVDYN